MVLLKSFKEISLVEHSSNKIWAFKPPNFQTNKETNENKNKKTPQVSFLGMSKLLTIRECLQSNC